MARIALYIFGVALLVTFVFLFQVVGAIICSALLLVTLLCQFSFQSRGAEGGRTVGETTASDRPTRREIPFERPRIEVTQVPASGASEEIWSRAKAEFDGPNRRAGPWARAYAESNGDEAKAQASYLRQRASEMHRDLLAELEALAAHEKQGELDAAQRAYASQPKGYCPNCSATVLMAAAHCKCGATFDGAEGSWRPISYYE